MTFNLWKKAQKFWSRGIKSLLPDWRTGSPLSRIGRVIFEKPQTKKLLGIGLSGVMVLSSLVSPSFGAVAKAESNQEIITPPQKVLTTEHTFHKPVNGVVSQSYHWYHQAVDIACDEGKQVKPIADGKVVQKDYQFFGYGNFIIIDHGNGYISLYAHLEKTAPVEVDQEVKRDTTIGLAGSTGRSTGPHLHLEVTEDGKNIDPCSVIEE